MNRTLIEHLATLPELYQAIYGHPELSQKTSRACSDRLNTILQAYDALQVAVGRPLRILDLGCAQGFFSLSLAAHGAVVHGIDFLDKNINVCSALAEENPKLEVSFSVGRVEDALATLESDQYDIILGLSVLHHVVHEHGLNQVKGWLQHAAEKCSVLILELALREEPLYWATSQPVDPRDFLTACAFVHELERFDTHLSSIARPLLVASNYFWILGDYAEAFDAWTTESHPRAQNTHEGSRRYFYGSKFFCKQYYFKNSRGQYNKNELLNEIAFLSKPPSGMRAPVLLTGGFNDSDGWVVMECLRGKLLLDVLEDGTHADLQRLFRDILVQLVALEAAGLCHSDLRTWNVMLLDDGSVQLLDFGAVSTDFHDCVWPRNIYFAFFIFVRELLTGQVGYPEPLRSISISPDNLPSPFNGWAQAMWQLPMETWSFHRMLELLDGISGLPLFEPSEDANVVWVGALESALQVQNLYIQNISWRLSSFFPQNERRLAKTETDVAHVIASMEEPLAKLQQMEAMEEQAQVMAEQARVMAEQARVMEEQARVIGEQAHVTARQTPLGVGQELPVEVIEHQLNMVYASRSWRLTAPLRRLGAARRSLLNVDISTEVKEIIKKTIRNVAQWVVIRLHVKSVVLKALKCMPRLKVRLDKVVQHVPASFTDQTAVVDVDGSTLSSHASSIYVKLQTAITNKRGVGK